VSDDGDFCRTTGKRMYVTKAEVARGTKGLHDAYPYRCDYCGYFHFARRRRTVERIARTQERLVE